MAEIQHAPGELRIPEGVGVVTGSPNGARRGIGVVVSRFNGDITTRLLEGALQTLSEAGVPRERIDVMPVPGAFELPLGAMALAKTRRYACIVALGCVIRGDTPHFEYVAGEAASGLQLAGLETGVPVSFGVLTCDSRRQAEERAGGPQGNKGSEAALSALEMADLLTRLRPAATPYALAILALRCRRSAQSAGKVPRSETTEATRWWPRSGGSTRTSSASAFS
jgi:6,7-dimethyl-8-ribityllumazine synthase